MTVLKCKMCGGDLVFEQGATVCECEYCGSKQTIPNADNEKKMTLFARANRLLRSCEFDKAEGIFESIVAEFPEEAEAYWGLVLCKYGIEYVDDPATGKKVPTCHRSSFDSVMDDADFDQVMENADTVARAVYREQAKQIEELRKGIIEVSGKEEPYDIFICYKETDVNKERTLDSVLAQDIYDALTAKGYRVFFSRISLEDKLGVEYEPYIFAALNSAKVMLAIGTSYDYYNAVWVKNEWSRYLKLMAADKGRHLIPCYKDIDAYDIPKEFAKLQAQDLGKVGAIQDLLRGIEKLIGSKEIAGNTTPAQTIIVQQSGGVNADSLLKRGWQALEDEAWDNAAGFFDRALDIDAKNAEAFFGKFCVERKYRNENSLAEDIKGPDAANDSSNFRRALQFSNNIQKAKWQELVDFAIKKSQDEQRRLEEAPKRLPIIRRAIKAAHVMISADDTHSVGLKADGTVVATEYKGKEYNNQCEIGDWNDIIAVLAEKSRTFGLKSDGRVIRTEIKKDKYDFEKDVETWTDIASFGKGNIIPALKTDGSVVVGDSNYTNNYGKCDVSNWENIVEIQTGSLNTFGLKDDGTVIATECKYKGDLSNSTRSTRSKVGGYEYDGRKLRSAVEGWKNIVSISVSGKRVAGVKEDGTVVAEGLYDSEMDIIEKWKDVVEIGVGSNYTVGLRKNGTVVAAGRNNAGQCDVEEWRDIVTICASVWHVLGIKADGTVVSTILPDDHDFNCGQCDVKGWKLFSLSDLIKKVKFELDSLIAEEGILATAINEETLKLEKEESKRQTLLERQNKEKELLEEQVQELQSELKALKGLFTGKRRKEIEQAIENIRLQQRGNYSHEGDGFSDVDNAIATCRRSINQYNKKIKELPRTIADTEQLIKELENLNQP